MFLRGHMQNAYVTRDLDKAMEIVGERYGFERFDRFDPDMVVSTPHGDEPMVVRVASAWAGGLNIEIIEPVSGYVDHYATMLPADRADPTPRFHHVSLRRDDLADMRAEIARLGLPLAFEGPVAIREAIPSLVFVYLDARASLGHYVEYTWKSPEAWAFVGWPEGRPVW
ncbi:MAG TPA: VOC family protein [Novosphingobium sp.]|nr:VOC family protein [Novosphingobium sp.]